MNTIILPVTEYNAKMGNRFNMTFHNSSGKLYKRGYVVEYNGQASYFTTKDAADSFLKNPIVDIQQYSTPESRYNS